MRKIKGSLTTEGINSIIRQLEEYRDKTLVDACREFVNRLTIIGVKTAVSNPGKLGYLIYFSRDIKPTQYGCDAVVYGGDIQKIFSAWLQKDGSVKMAEVSPLLMEEFGSGQKAQNPKDVPGVGQGTFPPGGHGTEPGWYWKDLKGKWHYSTGFKPSQPMYKAWLEMYADVTKIAKEVFSNV